MSWPTFTTLENMVDQTRTTLRAMQHFIDAWKAHPFIVTMARRIVGAAGAKTPPQESEAIRAWVRQNITYRRDPEGVEYLQDPIVTLTAKAGDCDDLATLAGTLLAALGHRVEAVGVAWKGVSQASHAVIHDDLVQVIVDPVADCHISQWPPKGYAVGHFVMVAK